MCDTRFFTSEAGTARSAVLFAATMAVTVFAIVTAFSLQDQDSAHTLKNLSGTQYLSSQKLR